MTHRHDDPADFAEGALAGLCDARGDLLKAVRMAAEAAIGAADATSGLEPKLGRARPLAEKSLGHADPGAISFAWLAATLAEAHDSDATGRDAPSR